jgi:hypothetical protein
MKSKKITSLNPYVTSINQKYVTVKDYNYLKDDFDAMLPSDGTLKVDTISEYTSATGVTIDVGSKFKDGLATLTGQSGGATIKAHAHSCTAEYANEFKGEFLNSSSTMDGIAAHYIMNTTGGTGTGVMRSILGVAYLPAGVAITGTSAAGSWISGGGFAADVAATATLNGTAVRATGLFAKVSSAVGANMTSCKQVSAATFISSLLVAPSAGIASIIHLAQEATGTKLPHAIYVEGADYCDALITIDAAAADTCAIASAVAIGSGTANTSYAIKIKIGTTPFYIPAYATSGFLAS